MSGAENQHAEVAQQSLDPTLDRTELINPPNINGRLGGAGAEDFGDDAIAPDTVLPYPGNPSPDLSAAALIDATATKVVSQLAPLLGEQAADLVAYMDRWFVSLQAAIRETATIPPRDQKTQRTEAKPRGSAKEPTTEVVLRAALRKGWQGWVSHGTAELCPDGIVRVARGPESAGIVSPLIALSKGGLYRVTATLAGERFKDARLRLRVTDPYGEPVGQETALETVETRLEFFVPHRIAGLKLYVVCHQTHADTTFALETIRLEKVDPGSYFWYHRRKLDAPCIASLASIPSRRPMLRDAVESLLVQCDRVRVLLNEYEDIPDFLNHPRVDVKRSQEWDDKGDAGKFAWVDAADEPGYRVIVDDDLVYPPDFTRRMVDSLARYKNRAIVGLHGVLLKQPITNYYDPASRSVVHFETALYADRSVHVLGTNAVVFHSSCVTMGWSDCTFRNMADIFLARYAQRHHIPMVMVSRPKRWVSQNTQFQQFETIFDSSIKGTRSKFDSSITQSSVIRRMAPITLQPTIRPKVVLCLIATDAAALAEAVETWQATRPSDLDWVLIVAAGVENDEVRKHISCLTSPTELHVLPGDSRTPAESVTEMLLLAGSMDAAAVCVTLDSVRFVSGRWASDMLARLQPLRPRAIHLVAEKTGRLAYGGAYASDRPFPVVSLLDPRLLQPGRFASATIISPETALRAAYAGTGSLSDAFEPDAGAILTSMRQHNSEAAQAALSRTTGLLPLAPNPPSRSGSINGVFERVVALNLDRRKDRWDSLCVGLARAGVVAERFRAVDGKWDEIATEYRSYCSRPLVAPGVEARKVNSSKEFYRDYESQRARVAYLEQSTQKKAIASAGAWAYLRSWEKVLEQALVDNVSSMLVLDDDVVFHKDCQSLFRAATAELPDDWPIMQLGTLQYHWEDDWVSRFSSKLYRSPGFAVGSHAVGLRAEVMPFLLEHVQRMELPFDTGALAAATRAFPEQCFITMPNLAIQRLDDSDIATSEFQRQHDRKEIMKLYRWTEADYEYRIEFDCSVPADRPVFPPDSSTT